MAERGITEEQVELTIRRHIGPPEPGNRPDTIVFRGPSTLTTGGNLKVVVDSVDTEKVVSVMIEEARSR